MLVLKFYWCPLHLQFQRAKITGSPCSEPVRRSIVPMSLSSLIDISFTFFRTGAIENECYVVAAAQFGQHNSKRSSYGHACIIDPWGNMTVQCSDKEPDLGAAEIDLAYVEDVRKKIPNWGHRRPDLYSSQVVHYASDQN